MNADDERFMRMALDVCRRGIEAGQSPFGACMVDGRGDVLACEHNHVWREHDPTAHAEVRAVREACRQLQTVHLPGTVIYSTTEPCPMCFSAIHWARIDRIVYAAAIADAQRFGFNELPISNTTLKQAGGTTVTVVPHVLVDEAVDLYRYWQDQGGRVY